MPGPTLNWAPQGAGWNRPAFVPEEVHLPSETRGWSPGPGLDWGPNRQIAHLTEAGGAMMSKGNAMNGMGDMFTFPEGTDPQQFFEQQMRTGGMPIPGRQIPIDIQGQHLEETYLYDRAVGQAPQVGQMPWESGPAPWEQTALPNHMMGPVYPGDAPHEIAAMQATAASHGDAKAVQAAKAAKVAADNAIRAAKAGAPQVAATNAATAQAAASVAAQSARGGHGRKAAAIAANEATKAVAAANVAANGASRSGMGDWMELSGMGAYGSGVGDTIKRNLPGFLVGAALIGIVLPWMGVLQGMRKKGK